MSYGHFSIGEVGWHIFLPVTIGDIFRYELSGLQHQSSSFRGAGAAGDQFAENVLALRQDANYLLTTILWGNVSINVLLTLLSDSVMAGVLAFCFSTILITLVGEIIPQAYFSRHALKMASLLAPVLRFYQIVLYPVAKPTAKILDKWLGPEGIHYFRERDLREVIKMHMAAEEAEVDHVEGSGR